MNASIPSVAFLFPGQGSQSVGMGAALRAAEPARFEHWMRCAEEATGLPVREYAERGPAGALTATEVAQPAVLALTLAVAETADALGLRPDRVAGHGLGEYAAAVVAGVLEGADAMRLVAERGRLMAAARREQSGAMGFVLGLPPAGVERVCAQTRQRFGYVTVAHVNSPRQVIVSGHASAVDQALALAGRFGARAGLLPVGAGYHSLLMTSVQARLARTAATMPWRDAHVPLVSGADARALTSGASVRAKLLEQMTRPVRWTDCMEGMLGDGVRLFLELGPGRVLTGLARQHSRRAVAVAADNPAALTGFAARLADAHLPELDDRLTG